MGGGSPGTPPRKKSRCNKSGENRSVSLVCSLRSLRTFDADVFEIRSFVERSKPHPPAAQAQIDSVKRRNIFTVHTHFHRTCFAIPMQFGVVPPPRLRKSSRSFRGTDPYALPAVHVKNTVVNGLFSRRVRRKMCVVEMGSVAIRKHNNQRSFERLYIRRHPHLVEIGRIDNGKLNRPARGGQRLPRSDQMEHG